MRRSRRDDKVWWNAEETAVFGRGESASVETTGLAVQALLKWGQASGTATKALSYIASKKDASGTWGTTQATIMALRALLLSTQKGAADVRGTLEVTLNGKPVEKLVLTPENNDLLHQFVLKGIDAKTNSVGIRFDGKGGLAYQVVGQYFVPWNEKNAKEALSIDVAYDRERLAQDDIATATATVKNNLAKVANMVMVDLGIPPGFDLLSEDLQALQEKTAGLKGGRLEKFSLTATQAILYFDSIGAGSTVSVKYRLRAKYPIRARTLLSRVYEYYDPEVNSVARPVQLEVRDAVRRWATDAHECTRLTRGLGAGRGSRPGPCLPFCGTKPLLCVADRWRLAKRSQFRGSGRGSSLRNEANPPPAVPDFSRFAETKPHFVRGG